MNEISEKELSLLLAIGRVPPSCPVPTTRELVKLGLFGSRGALQYYAEKLRSRGLMTTAIPASRGYALTVAGRDEMERHYPTPTDPWRLLRELSWRIDDCHKNGLDLFAFASAEHDIAKEALRQHDAERRSDGK